MSASVFMDKSISPDKSMLEETLGNSFLLWQEIKKYILAQFGDCIEEWKYYNSKSGWILKTLRKKRNLFFFTPFEDSFRVTFVFGDKAVAVIEQSDLPESIISELVNARKYMEGRGLSIIVKSKTNVAHIKKLIEIKINN